MVKDKDEKVVKKLSKDPEKLARYEESVKAFNSFLKNAVAKEWDFSNR